MFFKKGDIMPNSPKKKEYNAQYAKNNLKRVPLDIQKEKYEEIKAAAEKQGESLNGYIKKAIERRMEQEN